MKAVSTCSPAVSIRWRAVMSSVIAWGSSRRPARLSLRVLALETRHSAVRAKAVRGAAVVLGVAAVRGAAVVGGVSTDCAGALARAVLVSLGGPRRCPPRVGCVGAGVAFLRLVICMAGLGPIGLVHPRYRRVRRR